MIKIDVWTDFTCPFSYISRRLLQSALKQTDLQNQVQIIYRSYLLYPNAPHIHEETISQSLSKKYGISEEEAQSMMYTVGDIAKEQGLHFKLDDLYPTNTKTAHRLAKLASKYNLQDVFQERMLKAFFVEQRSLDQLDELRQLTLDIGLPQKEVNKTLANSALFEDDVEEDLYTAQELGIRGVPFFIINENFSIIGAQPVGVFVEKLEQAKKQIQRV